MYNKSKYVELHREFKKMEERAYEWEYKVAI